MPSQRMRLAKGWGASGHSRVQTLRNVPPLCGCAAWDLRLMSRLPCTEEQINLASAGLVGEIYANATSRLLPGHGNYSL